MNRRACMAMLAGATVWPLAARAQQGERVRRIGVLMGIESGPDARTRIAAFRQVLREAGWDDRHVRIEVVWGPGDPEHVRAEAAELVATSPHVILANGPVPTLELQKTTRSIPIVFVQVPDPVDLGVVTNMARPGANITGFTHFEMAFAGKWLEALKEIAPRTRRVMFMSLAGHPAWPGYLRTITASASSFGVEVIPAPVSNAAEVERAVEEFARAAGIDADLAHARLAHAHELGGGF
jgi:putative tryptophan/tyrosine transport system substrate-binding protein